MLKPLERRREVKRLPALLAPFLMLFFFAVAPAAHAADSVTFDGSPGTSAPPLMLGAYPMEPAPADVADTWTAVSEAPLANGDLTFSVPVGHYRIGDGWATWSHDYQGDVYVVQGAASVTMTLPVGTGAFYFYAEPNQFGDYTITATSDDGTTSGPVSVSGNAGARYFGFYAPFGSAIATVTVTANDWSGFAVGEFATQRSPMGAAPQGGGWVLAPISAVNPAVDQGDYSDGNGDGWAAYFEAPGSVKHDGGVVWKDNTAPLKG